MGEIYCTECGEKLDDTAKFCSNCGAKVDDKITMHKTNERTNNIIENTTNKTNNGKYSNTTKIFLGIVGVCIILFIIGVIFIGSTINNSNGNTNTNGDNSEQPFIENIYGINFSIPGYFKNAESKDYEKDGNGAISCTRTYERPDGTGIAIIVSTNPDGWNLNNYAGTPTIINGHYGKLSNDRGVFGYISGDKLIIISGTSQEEVEEMIIE